jgi:hypothetical protein
VHLIHESQSPSPRKMCTGLLCRCHLCPIWPPALPLNLTFISIFLSQLPRANLPYRGFLHSTHKITCPFSFIQITRPSPRPFVAFHMKLILNGEELLAQLPTPKLEDHPFSSLRNCLFNILAATLHIWRPSPPSATWGRAMARWQETCLTWKILSSILLWNIWFEHPPWCVSLIKPKCYFLQFSAPYVTWLIKVHFVSFTHCVESNKEVKSMFQSILLWPVLNDWSAFICS